MEKDHEVNMDHDKKSKHLEFKDPNTTMSTDQASNEGTVEVITSETYSAVESYPIIEMDHDGRQFDTQIVCYQPKAEMVPVQQF